MSRKILRCLALSLSLWTLSAPDSLGANSFGINVYGLSRHLNDRDNREINEVNIGIGMRASFGIDSEPILFFLEGGTFNDTFENQAKYISAGLQVRLAYQLRLGLNTGIYVTESIRQGDPFIAPVPIISYTIGSVTLNGVYLPRYEDVNPWHTVAAYVTVHLFKSKPHRNDG